MRASAAWVGTRGLRGLYCPRTLLRLFSSTSRLPRCLSGKERTCQGRRCGFDPWVRKIPQGRAEQPTPVFLPRKSHRQRSLVGYSPQGLKSQTRLKRLSTAHTHPLTGPQAVSVQRIDEPLWPTSECLPSEAQFIRLYNGDNIAPSPGGCWQTSTRANSKAQVKNSD